MPIQYRVMRPGQPEQTGEVDWPADPGYRRISALVTPLLDGQPLERVTVLHEGQRADMFVDETGAEKGLPRNEAATAIYRCNTLTRSPGTDPETLPAIYGPAVLMSRRVWF